MLSRSISNKISDGEPVIEFTPGSDQSLHEVYCEAVRKSSKECEVTLKWPLYNSRTQTAWPEGMQVIPILCAPSVRMFFESEIAPLEP